MHAAPPRRHPFPFFFLLPLSCSALLACAAPSGSDARLVELDARLDARLAEVFLEKGFDAKAFGPARWLDGTSYLTVEEAGLVRCDAESGARLVLIAAGDLVGGGQALSIEDYAFAGDGKSVLVFTNTRKVWRHHTRGDYWVFELATKKLRKLGGALPEASLMFAKFSPDGSRVAYVSGNDLWVEVVASGAQTRLTHDGSPTSINGTSDWVYEEEFDLRDGFRWSPDSLEIAFWHFDSTGVPLYTLVNASDSLYPTLTTIPYPKAGQTNSAVKVGVIAASGGEPRWLELPGDPRQMYVPRMEWVEASGELVVQQMDRRQQENTVWLVARDTLTPKELLREREPKAWLDVVDDWRWLPGGELFWISERDGWRHAWSVSRAGEWRCLTPGEFDLQGIVGLEEGWLYYLASLDDSVRKYLYRVPLAGGVAERLTPADQPGSHTYDLAPGGKFALHTRSTFDAPPFVELVSLPDHRTVRVLEDNAELAAKMGALDVQPAEFFRLQVEPGIELDGWMLRPRDFDPARAYPLLMHVYNEPSSVQAVDTWRGVRGMFHHALAEAGYVVACVDTQGTPGPRGKAWRKATYQRYAPVGARQQAAAVKALCAERAYLDPARIAVWGWSGGGSMTLNLLFRHPGVYRLGMSVAPVPDVTLYDSIYQERYTGLPSTDAEAYRLNSPIHFAEGLRDKLLLIHGSGDDNVHMQGSERLANRLIELGLPFDFLVYPNRSHSINEGQGTLHHLYTKLARTLRDEVPR